MAGMDGLGRLFNGIPIAAGAGFSMQGQSAVTFMCTGNDTFTLTKASSFAGAYTNLAVIVRYYTNTSTNGTAGWVKVTQAAAATVTIASGAVMFAVLTSQLSDPSNYLKVTVGASGLVAAIPHDLTVQRAPANLAILGA